MCIRDRIGRIYYEKMKAGQITLDDDVMEICGRIDAHYKVIEDTEKTLELYSQD